MIQGTDRDGVEGTPVAGGRLVLESTSIFDLRGLSGLQPVHSAVPEPATVAILGLGLAALLRRGRPKKTAA